MHPDESTLPADPWGLTKRERQVLSALCELESNKRVADDLCLSVRTVEAYIVRAMKKIRARGRVQCAVAWALFARGGLSCAA
jgi:DNA-binding NarL/FixJ family response regulator